MFTLKQPDQFGLVTAERINAIGNDMKSFMVTALLAAFRELFYDGETLRSKADIRRVLAAFEVPAELFQRHTATVQYLLSQYPDCMTEAEYTPPVVCVVNEETGTVTIPD